MLKNVLLLATLLAALFSTPARAVLTIEITQGIEAGIPIAVVPFAWQGTPMQDDRMADIIQADLNRSGRFESIPRQDFLSRPSDIRQVKYKDWRLLKAEALVVGQAKEISPGKFNVQFQLIDVFKGKQLAGYRYTVSARQLRKLSHQISDIIYHKLTGEKGAFNTRIAYITREKAGNKKRYLLKVADSDGYKPRTILESPQPLMSPAWSPDASKLAYVSFEKRRSMIFVQRLNDGKREKIASFKGINSAPAFSPDGRKLAFVTSKDGNPEIYVYDFATRAIKRLTRHHGIDTEPSWMPGSNRLVFTSDRSGQPQVYQMNADGSGVSRLTYKGKYNARPSVSDDGRLLVMISRGSGRYHVAVMDMRTKEVTRLTDTLLDESPSFAPNGRMVLYATEQQGKGVLAAVSADGKIHQTIKFLQGDVREPAWSPYLRR
jgi:TolB protein